MFSFYYLVQDAYYEDLGEILWEEAHPIGIKAPLSCRLRAIKSTIVFLLRTRLVYAVRCRLLGHVLVDGGSHANLDSASDSYYCIKCQASWSHIYY